jgi:hypothetical protein
MGDRWLRHASLLQAEAVAYDTRPCSSLQAWYDTLAVWQEWADDVQGTALPCSHYLPDEAAAETLAELIAFLSG